VSANESDGLERTAPILYLTTILVITTMSLCIHFLPGQRKKARRASGHGLETIRHILAAESIYHKRTERYGRLKDLIAAQLISEDLADGSDHGYYFSVYLVKPELTFYITASPVKKASSAPYLFSNQTGLLYYSKHGSIKADAEARPRGNKVQQVETE
jgi:hypothetical protein